MINGQEMDGENKNTWRILVGNTTDNRVQDEIMFNDIDNQLDATITVY